MIKIARILICLGCFICLTAEAGDPTDPCSALQSAPQSYAASAVSGLTPTASTMGMTVLFKQCFDAQPLPDPTNDSATAPMPSIKLENTATQPDKQSNAIQSSPKKKEPKKKSTNIFNF